MALLLLGLQWTREQVGVHLLSHGHEAFTLVPLLSGVLTIFNPIGCAAS